MANGTAGAGSTPCVKSSAWPTDCASTASLPTRAWPSAVAWSRTCCSCHWRPIPSAARCSGQAFWRLQPSHGFVDSRQQLLDWLAVGDSNTAPGVLIANQLPGRLPGSPRQRVLAFASLCGELQEPRPIVLWRAPTTQPQLWSEEDTRWQGGLGVVLEQWLNSGHGLAFAESRDSASRDRREVAPSGLLLSPERLQNLADEIEQRLAPQDTWRRRLCEWSLAHPERFFARLLKQRVRRLLGFQRLQYIWQPSTPAKLPATFNQWRLQAPGRKSA